MGFRGRSEASVTDTFMGSSPTWASASRSRIFERAIRPWLQAHPGATVVELGANSSVQFHRCDDGKVWWICVGLPSSLDARDNYHAESDHCHQVFADVLDLSWMDEVDTSGDVLIAAVGLFMYLEKAAVKRLLQAIVERFPGSPIVFDTIPHWHSRRARKHAEITGAASNSQTPWGINQDEIHALLRQWRLHLRDVSIDSRCYPHDLRGEALRAVSALPIVRNRMPAVVQVHSLAKL